MKLTAKERIKIMKALFLPILGGNERPDKKEKGLTAISNALQSVGYELDMVTGDTILGDKGSRLLSFSKQRPADSDIFTPGEMVTSCGISFNWEKFDEKRVEIIAYLT